MKSKNAQKLAKCRVDYLGRGIPLQTDEGVESVYGPIDELFRRGRVKNYKGTDAWLRIYSSGIAIHFIQSQKVDFIPIRNMKLSAAVKCNHVEMDEDTGERIPTLVPLTSNTESDHPALFAITIRRPWGVKVLDCLIFACKTDDAALSLVAASEHAYNNKDDWNKPWPGSAAIMKEDTKNEKRAAKQGKQKLGKQNATLPATNLSNGAPNRAVTYVPRPADDIPRHLPSHTQSLIDAPFYNPWRYTRMPPLYAYSGFSRPLAHVSNLAVDRASLDNYAPRSVGHYQKEFSINGIVMGAGEDPNTTYHSERRIQEAPFKVNGVVTDHDHIHRRPVLVQPTALQDMHLSDHHLVFSNQHARFRSFFDAHETTDLNVNPATNPELVTTAPGSSISADFVESKRSPPVNQFHTNVFEVRTETYSEEKVPYETQEKAMDFDIESVAGTIPKRIHPASEVERNTRPFAPSQPQFTAVDVPPKRDESKVNHDRAVTRTSIYVPSTEEPKTLVEVKQPIVAPIIVPQKEELFYDDDASDLVPDKNGGEN